MQKDLAGVLRGRVVLPRWALGLEPAQRRLMVLHEAEHVRAGDPQLALAGLVVCALMPWNVAAWWQLGRLRLALEMDCDARVLARSDDVRSYGSLLLEVGQRRGAGLAVGLAETRSSLERRIRMMTETTTGRRTLRALGLAAVSGGVLAMACETPVVASAVRGIPSIVVDHETGRLVPFAPRGPVDFEPKDPEKFARDLADAVNTLLQNPERRAMMGRLGRKRVEDHFSWRAVAEQTLAFYRRLLA